MIRRLTRLKELIWKIISVDIGTYAASSAFFLFLSLFPMLILLSLLLPVTGLTAEDVIRNAVYITPDLIDDLVKGIIQEIYGQARGLLPVTVVIVLWSSTKSMKALIRGIRLVYDIPVSGNILLSNLVSFAATLAVAVFLLLSMVGLIFANAVFHESHTEKGFLPGPIAQMLEFRYLIILILATMFMLLLYTLVSGTGRMMRDHIPGAVMASLAMSAFTGAFSMYVGYNQHYQTIYGSFTAFVIMFLWGYFCIYIMLICGRFNNLLWKRRQRDRKES